MTNVVVKVEKSSQRLLFLYFEHTMTSTVAFRDRKSFVVPLKVSSYNIIDFCQFSWDSTIILTVVKDHSNRYITS